MKNAFFSTIIALLFSLTSAGQKWATISGKVVNEVELGMAQVSVTMLGRQAGSTTNDTGFFQLRVPANKAFALIFSYSGYGQVQQNFLLNEGENETVLIKLEPKEALLQEVIVTDDRQRTEAGLIKPNPKAIINMPSPVTGVESMIKIFVGSNNELTSQYNVRGGSYDENIVYVNDFEIYRPYLVRSGQQEGLSFINPELVRNINFYNGGFGARYGDRMSSVLDVQYNKPRKWGGSAYASLLEQGFHTEGVSRNNKFTYLFGVRNRNNQNLLSRQETTGNYVPSSADLQALLTYNITPKWSAEMLGNISATRFTLIPQRAQKSSAIFTPFLTRSIGVDIGFSGQEKDAYTTGMLGFAATYQANKKLRLKWLVSRFENRETENFDITGAYVFGDLDLNRANAGFGTIVNPLGAGVFQNFARNSLAIVAYNVAHKGSLDKGRHLIQWGADYNKTNINDRLNEWEYNDSAGYALPYSPNLLQLNRVVKTSAQLNINRLSGYVQDNLVFKNSGSTITLQAGLRFNYNDLNNELLLSPRLGASYKPEGRRDIVFRAAAGAYHQPPFYRELRRYDGSLNTDVKAQKSWQAVGGFDYNFKAFNRALRVTTEAYYKYMTDVVPYDIDNVRVRYYGTNSARAYAVGWETRLFGEVVKDAESWISFGLMRTRENLDNDFYQKYTTDSTGKPTDSVTVAGGWLRRPTDRLLTFGMFFQDYLATNKNFKVYLSTLYGSNLPYNIPGSVQYRNALRIDPYIRVDIGFSALLLDSDKAARRSHSPFRNFNNIWASLEVFNLIDRPNTVSYQLIKDFNNNTFTLPNRLTPRLLNLKLVARW